MRWDIICLSLQNGEAFVCEVVPVTGKAACGVYNEMVQQLKGEVDSCENCLRLLEERFKIGLRFGFSKIQAPFSSC
jgi:hypothetical protein